MAALFSLCSPRNFVCIVTDNNKNKTKPKKCPEQLDSLDLHIRESCCDKLCRWLNTAIRRHTVCLTKCFLSDTLELSWPLAAWFQVFIWAPLGGSVSISTGFAFVTTVTPPQRTHGALLLTGPLQLDYIFTLMEPCWISVVVHSESSIHQTQAILCHVLTYLLTCFIWEQMLLRRRCRWKSLLCKFSY